MSPFFYQLKRELSLSKKDPATLAANPPLQKLFTDSHAEQVVWSSDKAWAKSVSKRGETHADSAGWAKKISWEAYLYIRLSHRCIFLYVTQIKRARYLSRTDKKALAADAKLTKIWDKLEASKREMYKDNIVVTWKTCLTCMFVLVQMINCLMC